MRQDSGFLSIYDEKGEEIENCEIVFADEGRHLHIFAPCGSTVDVAYRSVCVQSIQ